MRPHDPTDAGGDAPVFTPENEPYLGRQSVYEFDQIIVSAMDVNRACADVSRGNLSLLQSAGCELVPQGFSIALSIRELVRQGYLFSAEILLRPLIERAATISWLCENPNDLHLWEEGWPYKKRPPLQKMLVAMRAVRAEATKVDQANTSAIIDYLNSMVHGDRSAAIRNLGTTRDGSVGFLSSKNLTDDDKCDHVCSVAAMMLIVLMARATQVFLSSGDDRRH